MMSLLLPLAYRPQCHWHILFPTELNVALQTFWPFCQTCSTSVLKLMYTVVRTHCSSGMEGALGAYVTLLTCTGFTRIVESSRLSVMTSAHVLEQSWVTVMRLIHLVGVNV